MNLAKAVRDPWVQAQFALLLVLNSLGPALPRVSGAAALGSVLTRLDPWPLRAVGTAICALGFGFAAWGVRALGAALTPEPEPLPGATLIRSGPYRLVRHPIYTGILAASTGWTLAWSNWTLALLVAVVLGSFFEAKARVEERWLRARFPEYDRYADRVRWRVTRPDPRRPAGLP
jgi:protein-S-isoprenylcysteine O-methyltransferase Ste14